MRVKGILTCVSYYNCYNNNIYLYFTLTAVLELWQIPRGISHRCHSEVELFRYIFVAALFRSFEVGAPGRRRVSTPSPTDPHGVVGRHEARRLADRSGDLVLRADALDNGISSPALHPLTEPAIHQSNRDLE